MKAPMLSLGIRGPRQISRRQEGNECFDFISLPSQWKGHSYIYTTRKTRFNIGGLTSVFDKIDVNVNAVA